MSARHSLAAANDPVLARLVGQAQAHADARRYVASQRALRHVHGRVDVRDFNGVLPTAPVWNS